jgi:hypothetical protein
MRKRLYLYQKRRVPRAGMKLRIPADGYGYGMLKETADDTDGDILF